MKSFRLTYLFLIFLGFYGCSIFQWEENDQRPYTWYVSEVMNGTRDTLRINFETDDGPGHSYYGSPGAKFKFYYWMIEDTADVFLDLLKSGDHPINRKQLSVYRHDSLLVSWQGVPQELPDSIHDFHNLNSWEKFVYEEENGVAIRFTISNSDLNKN